MIAKSEGKSQKMKDGKNAPAISGKKNTPVRKEKHRGEKERKKKLKKY